MKKNGVTFFGIERALIPGEIEVYKQNNFLVTTTIRDPKNYLLSKMVYQPCSKEWVMDSLRALDNGEIDACNCVDSDCLTDWKCHPGDFQSYFVRTFSGNFGLTNYSTRQTTDQDLEAAKNNLKMLDSVQILDKLDMKKMQNLYNWDPEVKISPQNVADHKEERLLRITMERNGDMKKLMRYNRHDVLFFQFAKKLHHSKHIQDGPDATSSAESSNPGLALIIFISLSNLVAYFSY